MATVNVNYAKYVEELMDALSKGTMTDRAIHHGLINASDKMVNEYSNLPSYMKEYYSFDNYKYDTILTSLFVANKIVFAYKQSDIVKTFYVAEANKKVYVIRNTMYLAGMNVGFVGVSAQSDTEVYIVCDDMFLHELSPEEQDALLWHEIGHIVRNDLIGTKETLVPDRLASAGSGKVISMELAADAYAVKHVGVAAVAGALLHSKDFIIDPNGKKEIDMRLDAIRKMGGAR